MKDYTKIYTIIFWLSLLYILLWVILKATGVINTPDIVELSPIISAVFAAGIFFQMMRDMKERLVKIENRTNKLEHNTNSIDKRLFLVESNFRGFDRRLGKIEAKI